MDGVTDKVFRRFMCQHFGADGVLSACVSEFVRVTDRPVPEHVMLGHCPELSTGGRCVHDVPVYFQILGSDVTAMAETARRAAKIGALGIDLNFGCPAKTVNRHDGGATLLKAPTRVREVTSAVRDALPPHVPLSVKVRLGWDHVEGVAEIAQAAQSGGAAWLTVHARTRAQGYAPPVYWHALGIARRSVAIPVVANGDITDRDALERCRQESGCHAFMIGRAALGRPEIFAQIRDPALPSLSLDALMHAARLYAHMLLAGDAPARAIAGLLKQWLRLGCWTRRELEPVFEIAKRCQDLASLLAALGLRGEFATQRPAPQSDEARHAPPT